MKDDGKQLDFGFITTDTSATENKGKNKPKKEAVSVDESEPFIGGKEIQIIAEEIEDSPKKDMKQTLNEFLKIDLSEDEISQLGYSELTLDVNGDGDYKLMRMKDKDAGRNLRHRLVAALFARGFDKQHIAEATSYSRSAITQILKTPWVRDAVAMFQDHVVERAENDKKMAVSKLGELAQEAVETLEYGLYSKDDSVRHKSAKTVLEGLGVFDRDKKSYGPNDIGEEIGNLIREGAEATATATALRVDFNKRVDEISEDDGED